MAFKLKSTKEARADGVRAVVYGPASCGKTRLIRTLDNPVILSCENGLQSLADNDIPSFECGTFAEAKAMVEWYRGSEEGQSFSVLAIDSLTELAEIALREAQPNHKNGMQAYGELLDRVTELCIMIRDMPGRNVIMNCKLDKVADEQNAISYGPLMSGQALNKWLPHCFPFMFAMHEVDGATVLQTQSDKRWGAKDRSGRLEGYEPADMGALIRKVMG